MSAPTLRCTALCTLTPLPLGPSGWATLAFPMAHTRVRNVLTVLASHRKRGAGWISQHWWGENLPSDPPRMLLGFASQPGVENSAAASLGRGEGEKKLIQAQWRNGFNGRLRGLRE